MSWKRGFFLAVGVLMASNAAWAYRLLDHSVTASYAADEHRRTHEDLAVLRRMIPESRPMDRSEVLALLRRTNPDALIVDDSAGVAIGGLLFEFTDDRLARIGLYGR